MKLDYLVGRPDGPKSREDKEQRERNPWSIGRQKGVAFAGLVFIAPSLQADLVELIIASPAIISQVLKRRAAKPEAA